MSKLSVLLILSQTQLAIIKSPVGVEIPLLFAISQLYMHVLLRKSNPFCVSHKYKHNIFVLIHKDFSCISTKTIKTHDITFCHVISYHQQHAVMYIPSHHHLSFFYSSSQKTTYPITKIRALHHIQAKPQCRPVSYVVVQNKIHLLSHTKNIHSSYDFFCIVYLAKKVGFWFG